MRKCVTPFLLSLVCIIMVLIPPPVTTAAEPRAEGNYTLTLYLEVEDPTDESKTLLLQGVEYRLYMVGERVEGNGGSYTYELMPEFEDFAEVLKASGMNLDGLDFWSDASKSLEDMALLFAKYVEDKDSDSDTDSAGDGDNDECGFSFYLQTTDAKGEATFTGLGAGLYLALGGPVTKDNRTYYPQATLAAVPFPLPNGTWINPVIIDAKAYGLSIDISVKKIWEGSGGHPSVTVELLRNGKPVGSTTLSANNNWSNTWENLDSNYKWTVRETTVPNGWQASYTQNGNIFTITNRRSTSPDAPMPASTDDSISSDDLLWPDTQFDKLGNRSLPQTSQLWWPVPLLVSVGVILLLTGAVLFDQKEESEEFEEPYE